MVAKVMKEGNDELFTIALNYLCKRDSVSSSKLAKRVGATQRTIEYARSLNTARGCGKKTAPKIAEAFNLPYEDMFSLGRWIKEGNNPAEWRKNGHNTLDMSDREKALFNTLKMAGVIKWLIDEDEKGRFPVILNEVMKCSYYRDWMRERRDER